MTEHQLAEQWLCRTCKYNQASQAPSLARCEVDELEWRPAVHVTDGCQKFVNAGEDE